MWQEPNITATAVSGLVESDDIRDSRKTGREQEDDSDSVELPVGQSRVQRGTSVSGESVVSFRNAYKAMRNDPPGLVAHPMKFQNVLNPNGVKLNNYH